MAVDLAKLSLWLVTLAKDHPFTFLDHALRHGDSLVGLTREQIIGFHLEPKKQKKFGEDLIQKQLDRATEARSKILSAREDVAYRDQEQRMAVANEALNLIRLVGDACVSCYFATDKNKAREEELERVFAFASSYFSSLTSRKQQQSSSIDFQSRAALKAASDRLIGNLYPIPCFHWEIEFPEVFSRENGGFDAFVGNPPFAGKNTISKASHDGYPDWLKSLHSSSHGNADLVAHFFRRAFDLLRERGAFGLIATNTIGQGDTRATGLRWICVNGGTIYNAIRRYKWPGLAAVVVSIVNIAKQTTYRGTRLLDYKRVQLISAYLFHAGGHEDPSCLICNKSIAFQGPIPLGMGLTFDDSDGSGVATPISEMYRLVEKNPKNQERIFPYIGGDEVLNDPQHSHRRYIINFGTMTEVEARQWPDLFSIVEAKVKGHRGSHSTAPWWQFERPRPELQEAISKLDFVLMHPFTSTYLAFARIDAKTIISGPHVVFAIDSIATFAVLQSRIHEIWFRFFGSSLEDRLRYVISDVFETFPTPTSSYAELIEPIANELIAAGQTLYDFRAQQMIRCNEGLTATYNRFHSPTEYDAGILELRRLHCHLDEVVLRTYGWQDLADQAAQPDFCQFLLDYEEDEGDSVSDSSSTRQKKKPWRYRWPDDFRDEVLARLLELNEQRHKEELLLVKGKSTEAKPAKEPSKKPARATPLLDGLDQVELDRDERLILLIVDLFKLITRTALDEAFIAMKYPKLRKSRLGLGDPPKSVPRTDAGRDALVGGLLDRGFLEKHPSDHQQVWKRGSSAPSLAATEAERQALEETKAIFRKSIEAGEDLASCKEGVTDAKPGLVSIA
jgi:hypothetical protein